MTDQGVAVGTGPQTSPTGPDPAGDQSMPLAAGGTNSGPELLETFSTRQSDRAVQPESPPRSPPNPAAPVRTIDRLRDPLPTDRLVGWLVTLTITAMAFVIRLVNLGYPNKLVFDETYYAKDGYSLLRYGYERAWPKDANDQVVTGNTDVMETGSSFIVHPPVGKWLIGFGEHLFGMNSFGWRFGSLVFGTLLVLVMIRLVRRVSRSTLIGAVAGLLLTFDGLAFVMSRTALLDIFLAFFLVAGVSCLAADRDWFRYRLADWLERHDVPDLQRQFGPALILRPWRLAAGVCFGLAVGTKWNALPVIAAFCVLSVLWDVGARRLAGAGWGANSALLRDGIPAFVSVIVLGFFVYLSTWIGWLKSTGGYDRGWGADHPDSPLTKVLGAPLASLVQYHRDIWGFHTGDFINSADHSYRADPGGWLVLARPIGIDAVNGIKPGTDGCLGPDNCIRVISGIGTPVLWWVAIIALIAALVLWIGNRDWRFGIPVVGVLAAWLPWFSHDTRPLFFFYAIIIIPFSVMAVALCLGRLLGRAGSGPGDRRMLGAVVGGTFVALVLANFAYIYPILTDQLLPYQQWLSRMWFKSWI